jgi:hypothetical protein
VRAVNKSSKSNLPKPLGPLVRRALSQTFARQGFASTELVTRWSDIVGGEIAAHAEPIKIQWARRGDAGAPEPAMLVLRVEGPVALEIQHLSPLILERVNRFFGWRAIDRIALRQAPLTRSPPPQPRPAPDPATMARIEGRLDVADEGLRRALARLGAAIEQS